MWHTIPPLSWVVLCENRAAAETKKARRPAKPGYSNPRLRQFSRLWHVS